MAYQETKDTHVVFVNIYKDPLFIQARFRPTLKSCTEFDGGQQPVSVCKLTIVDGKVLSAETTHIY